LLEELEATTRRAADLYGLIVGRTRVMTSASGPSATTPGNESS
jgi:hypothetical protein